MDTVVQRFGGHLRTPSTARRRAGRRHLRGRQATDSLTVENSEITNNTITTGTGNSDGAGISSNAVLALTDSTVSGNSIDGTGQDSGDGAQGGGLNVNTDLTILRSTISGNSVSGPGIAQGAGIFGGQSAPPRSRTARSAATTTPGPELPAAAAPDAQRRATLTNVTFANNTAAAAAPTLDQALRDGNRPEHDLRLHRTACAGHHRLGDARQQHRLGRELRLRPPSDGNQENTDPLLDPLALNAPGTTATHALQPTSPALDMADAGCGGGLSTDQRGVARPEGPACDVGAYELQYRLLTADKSGAGTGTVDRPPGSAAAATASSRSGRAGSSCSRRRRMSGSDFASWSGCDSSSGDAMHGEPRQRPPGHGELCGGATCRRQREARPRRPPTKKKCKKGQKLKKGKCVKKKKRKKKK